MKLNPKPMARRCDPADDPASSFARRDGARGATPFTRHAPATMRRQKQKLSPARAQVSARSATDVGLFVDGERGDRIVVITGGSMGVGRAAARAFARHGDDVVILARGFDAMHAAVRELRKDGRRVMALSVDVSDSDALLDAAEEIQRRLGPIDVWVNCAATSIAAPIESILPDDWRRVTDVTYHGTVFGTFAALAAMRPRDRGVIVQVESAHARRGLPLEAAYGAAKQAAAAFTQSLRGELKRRKSNIRIAAVTLPSINTPRYDHAASAMEARPRPLGRIYQPIVAADAVVVAADGRSDRIYVGWSAVREALGFPPSKRRAAAAEKYHSTGDALDALDAIDGGEAQSNLWDPVQGDPGAHGRFDDDARPFAMRVSDGGLRRWRAAAAGAIALIALALLSLSIMPLLE